MLVTVGAATASGTAAEDIEAPELGGLDAARAGLVMLAASRAAETTMTSGRQKLRMGQGYECLPNENL